MAVLHFSEQYFLALWADQWQSAALQINPHEMLLQCLFPQILPLDYSTFSSPLNKQNHLSFFKLYMLQHCSQKSCTDIHFCAGKNGSNKCWDLVFCR